MFSTKYFIDEKFKDTIKKNSYRLRQKSSYLIGNFAINKNKELIQSENRIKNGNVNEIENIEYIHKNKTTDRYRTPKNKIINFSKSIYNTKYQGNEQEEKQITVRKKISEECSSSIKQRILSKLKEKRNEKINNNALKSEKKNEANHSNSSQIIPKDILVNKKKITNSTDFENIFNRNKKNVESKNSTNAINNDENINLKESLKKNSIFSLKNINIKKVSKNLLEGRYSNSINNEEIDFKKEKNNEISCNNSLKGKAKSFGNNYNYNNTKNNNRDITTNYENNKNNNNNFHKSNDIIIVHKKPSFINTRYKFIKKKEEEKNKNYNDEIQNSVMINKKSSKQEKAFGIKETKENRFYATNTKKRFKNIENAIKLTLNKSPENILKECDYKLTNTITEESDNKKYFSHYLLSNEKPKLFYKTTLFKNLMINTENNDALKSMEKINKKNIFKNNLKSNVSDLNNKTNYLVNDNLESSQNLSNRQRGSGISDILKSDKKNYLEKNYKIKKITNNLIHLNKYNYDYVMKMINEAIQLKNSIEIQSLFSILLINFNNKYLTNFDYKDFPKEIPQFPFCYKYFSIIIIPLIFLHKDESIYANTSTQAKNIFEEFIYACIENIGVKNLSSKKIDSYIEEYNNNKINNIEKMSMEECCDKLIKLIFKNFKEYSPLKKATEQLLNIAKKESLEKIIYIINETILYCFNHKQKSSFYLLDQKFTGNRYKNFHRSNQLSGKELNKSISTPSTPFIRSEMKKNFCLVLDIDETIVHSLNLPFGNYFLLRPGVINFLEEISKLYEIIIFTSSPRIYADGILNKIDIDNNYFSHRLYKDHVIFEKGKSVKKLNMIGRELNKMIFVDNTKSNAKYNLKNLCHVSTWIYDINDQEIIKLKIKLKYIATNNKFKDDIRKGLEY